MVNCALVCGAGGFIGGHLVQRLKRDEVWVTLGISYMPKRRDGVGRC